MNNSRIALFSVLLMASCTITPSQGGENEKIKEWSARLSNPVSQPTIFEAPTIQAEIRPMIMHQRLSQNTSFPAFTSGGDFQVYALQLRYPITERLAFIATKDGWIDFNPKSNPLTGGDQEGFADIAGGLKYAIFENGEFLVTPGLIFETTVGQTEVFQGNGDGLFRPFVSVGWEPEPEINVLGNLGASLPSHGSQETQSIDWHLHVDYEMTETFSPLVEINGIYYSRNAKALPINFEGGDLINIGSGMVAGQNVITGAIGARFKIARNVDIGAAYGFPLSSRDDLFKDRITVDCTLTF